MTNFDKKIIELQREVNELKTEGMKSSSSLAVIERSVTFVQQIVGYDYNYHLDSCASKAAAIIEIIPSDGKAMMASFAMKSGKEYLTDRYVFLNPRIMNGHLAFEFRFPDGSNADLIAIQGGATLPEMQFEVIISATSPFTTNLTYRQDH